MNSMLFSLFNPCHPANKNTIDKPQKTETFDSVIIFKKLSLKFPLGKALTKLYSTEYKWQT